MTDRPHAVLICGVATDPIVWAATAQSLSNSGFEVKVPRRPQSGKLELECDFLAPLCKNAVVIGVSGGATLGLELAARNVPMSAAFLHEPAAGSLAPHLLDSVVAAFENDGVHGFGATLYGPAWSPSMTSADAATVKRELSMFRMFEPRPPTISPASVTLTVGENSPAARHASVAALSKAFGIRSRVLRGVGHAAHLENAFLPLINEIADADRSLQATLRSSRP